MNSEPQPGGHDDSPVSVSRAEPAPAFGIGPPPESAVSPVRWVGRGERVVVGGISIAGGLFYLGDTSLSQPGPLDACVIDERCALAAEGSDPPEGPSSFWLAYEDLTDGQRRTFLEWLASDRPGTIEHVGYLNLYLYGLERRIIVDAALNRAPDGIPDEVPNEVSASEYEDIAAELRRLLRVATDWSFLSHVENLLEVVTVLAAMPGRLYRQAPTVKSTRGYQVPLSVRVAFAQAAVDRVPVPAEWALSWVTLDSAIAKRAPVIRSGEQFRLLFVKKYRERFKEGMLVSVNRTALTMPGTAFPALRERPPPPCLAHLPDVSVATGPRKKLQQLVVECAETLRAYSRYLGRNPGSQGTLDAALVLPHDLWPQAFRVRLEFLAEQVQESIVVMSFGELLAQFKSTGGITRLKAVALVDALEHAGIAVEPDVRRGARTPKPADAIALFAAPTNVEPPTAEAAYSTASLMVDLAAALVRIEGDASAGQAAFIRQRIGSWVRFTAAQQTRLHVHAALQLNPRNRPATAASLGKRVKVLSADARQTVAAFLIEMANLEGLVTPAKVRMLETIYRALELDSHALYAGLHHDAARIRPATGEAKPHSPRVAARTGVPFVLDDARIAALRSETARVSMLLANVFADDPEFEATVTGAAVSKAIAGEVSASEAIMSEAGASDAVASKPTAPEDSPAPSLTSQRGSAAHPETPDNLLGLDDAHSTFLRMLVTRPMWTRAELVDAAGGLDLMLDGAIEQVNEASLDHWDEALTEGDDPVEINQALVQRLAA
jgi:hypothetical protein